MKRPTTSHYDSCQEYTTLDGSTIRELLHPDKHANQNQSLAEARVPAGGHTLLHRHQHSEELYYFLTGQGDMLLGDEVISVSAGMSVVIPPGTPHAIRNGDAEEMVLLCCCAPAYRHEDTELLEPRD